MKAKLYAILVFALIATALFATAFVLAEDNVVSSGTTNSAIASEVNDNLDESVSGLKIGWENFKLLFTFNNEKKAMQELKIARLRLIQAKIAAQKGNTNAVEKAQKAHDALIARAEVRIEAIQEDSEESNVKNAAEKLIGLEVALKAQENRIEVLKDILAKENLTDEAQTAIQKIISRMEDKTANFELKIEQKKEKMKTRLRAVTNRTKEEIKSEIEELEKKEGLVDAEKLIAEKRIEKTEEALTKIKENLALKKRILDNANLTAIINSKIAEAEAKLAEAKALYANGNYTEAIALLKPINNYGRNLSEVVRSIKEERKELKERIEAISDKLKEARGKANESAEDEESEIETEED